MISTQHVEGFLFATRFHVLSFLPSRSRHILLLGSLLVLIAHDLFRFMGVILPRSAHEWQLPSNPFPNPSVDTHETVRLE